MNKKGQLNVGMIVVIAVGVIFALAIMDEIINTQSELTTKNPVTDETDDLHTLGCYNTTGDVQEGTANCNITVDNWYPTGDWRASASECDISGVTVTNSTGDALTASTDYNLYEGSGIVEMLFTADTSNATLGSDVLIDYSYCGKGYNKDASSRSIAGLITLFAALAILAFVTIGIKDWIK